MEREIKFRSWLPEFGKMVYDQIGWINRDAHVGDAILGKNIATQNLMQFTGLKDKHGIEIYEGDIVRNEFGKINVVKHESAYDGDDRGTFFWSGFQFVGDPSHLEVVGDIHKNPELLSREAAPTP